MPGRHAIGGEAKRLDGDDVGAVKREQPARGPDELDVVVVAAGTRIAHHLGDGQLADRLVERVLQAADERLTLGEASQVHVVGLAVGGHISAIRSARRVDGRVGELRAAEAGELLPIRFGRLSRRVESHLGRHQLLDHLRIRRDGRAPA